MAIALISLTVCTALGSRASEAPAGAVRSLAAPSLGTRGTAPPQCPSARRGLAFYSRRAREWRTQRGARGTTAAYRGVRSGPLAPRGPRPSCPLVRRLAQRAQATSLRERRRFERWFRETYERWRCIHQSEGAWDDPHADYWGGLQFDWSFMVAHGRDFLERWGTADLWPVWAQLVTAERARARRGFSPWPNTARECGLL